MPLEQGRRKRKICKTLSEVVREGYNVSPTIADFAFFIRPEPLTSP